jgi:tetratricopeptide (TPR) repeat protein
METCLPLAETAGFGYPQVIGGANLGLLLAYLGSVRRARELGESAVAAAKRLMPPAAVVGEYLLALCDALDGDFAAADIRLAENDLPTTFPDYTLLTVLASVEANVRLIEGKPDQAVARIDKGLSEIPPESPPFLLNTEPLLVRARALAALGRNEEARAEFMRAIEISDKFESLYRRWDALAGMAGVEVALGNDKAAQKARKQARKALVALIATLDNPALEATFRALPEVAAVLSGV